MNKKPTHDLSNPFVAGQMVGMLVMLTFIEKNEGIPIDLLERLKEIMANNAQHYLKKPTEDIFLMVDDMVENIQTI